MAKTVFKNRIAFYMGEFKMRDTKTAQELGISRDTLYRLKTRPLARMDATTVKAVLDRFGVPFETMFYFEDDDD